MQQQHRLVKYLEVMFIMLAVVAVPAELQDNQLELVVLGAEQMAQQVAPEQLL